MNIAYKGLAMALMIGKSPVAVPVLIVGKLAFLGSFLFFIVKWSNVTPMLFDSPITQILGIVLLAGGLVMVVVAGVQLGRSVAVGLPEGQTEFKTGGLFSVTRNPMYLGGFIMCTGSCLYSIHAANVLLFAIAVITHLPIVKREEEFLANRFGQQWQDYRERVPRFIGIRHRSAGGGA